MKKIIIICLSFLLLLSGCNVDSNGNIVPGLTGNVTVVQGADGIDGINGTNGTQGIQGIQGLTGNWTSSGFTSTNLTDILGFWPEDAKPKNEYVMSFDGNDSLNNTTANFLSGDSSGAIEIWFKSSSVANHQTLFGTADTASTTRYFEFYLNQTTGVLVLIQRNNDISDSVRASTNTCDGKWHHAVLNSSGTAWSIILDGVTESLTTVSGANNGDWFADTASRNNLTVGALVSTSPADYLVGEIGVVRIYSQPLTLSECVTNHQAGRKADTCNAANLVFNLPLTEGTGNPVDTVGSLTMTLGGNIKWSGLVADSPTFSGNVTFSSYGAGTLVTDANGKISVSSDMKLKQQISTLNDSLKYVLSVNPIYFKWLEESGYDTENVYLGFSADEVSKYIPSAVGVNNEDTLTISDRALIAYLFVSIQQIQNQIDLINSSLKLPILDRTVIPDTTGNKLIKSKKELINELGEGK